ncbi:hypothetical protein Ddye_016628 [Dipteronia dyeriana]|uniref:hAT-like transposase RNase-H fold domain-containing protein n=1 Tax=Dipteronia dyeriana TaxID=168575 RepID=A0AAD9WZ09_9ROSI|nr:hypothetical protein Ddye_016628 [Dipteronia dyeriana]
MSELLNSYREDEHLGAAVVVMETKLKKYWANIPLLYALSAIIDPRVKLSGLEVLLEFIGINLSIDYSEQITDIRTKLFEIFHIYETRFGNIDIPQSTRPETEPKQTSWSLLKRRKKYKSASTSSGKRSSPSSCTELIRYLEAQFDAVEDKEEFDLLLWWKTHTYRLGTLEKGVVRAIEQTFEFLDYIDVEDTSCSGKPLGVLAGENHGSVFADNDMDCLRAVYGILKFVELRAPIEHKRADWDIPWWTCFYEYNIRHGFRFLVSSLARRLLVYYDITHGQLMPNV